MVLMTSVWQDLCFAARLFRRDARFTAVVVLILALGIGGSTGFFSVVYSVLFQPLPFRDPNRLTVVLSTTSGVESGFYSAPGVFLDWRDRASSFETLAGVRWTTALWNREEPRHVQVLRTSPSLLPLLGISPVLGRAFRDDEDEVGKDNVLLLDHGFWQREFGGNRAVLDQTMLLDDRSYTIVGVLPAGVRVGRFDRSDVWLPLAAQRQHRGGGDVLVAGRLQPGSSIQRAQAEMDAIMTQIGREHGEDAKIRPLVLPMREWIVGEVRRPLMAVLGAVAFLVFIGSINIGNLLTARAISREREMAIRASLGAWRFRLIRQLLIEGLLLAALGGALGLGLALAIVRLAPRISAVHIPRSEEIAIHGVFFAIAALVSLGSGLLFGLVPALRIRWRNLVGGLTSRGAPGDSAGASSARSLLVVAQIALAFILLFGAGLMTNTLVRLLNVDLGFEGNALVAVRASLPSFRYGSPQRMEFYRQLGERVSRIPGVQSVSISDYHPLTAIRFPYPLSSTAEATSCTAEARHVDPLYLRTLGIPLILGRDLEPLDDHRRPVPVLVNQITARLLFGSGNPIGRELTTIYADRPHLEIVGVVGEARQQGLTERPGAQIYLPLSYGDAGCLVVRKGPAAQGVEQSILAAFRALDPALVPPVISDMDQVFSGQIATPRFYTFLFAAFALAGGLLAILGVFGMIAHSFAQRRHEFGVRMALGADARRISRLLYDLGLRMTLAGLCLGVVGAVILADLLAALLYEVRPRDATTLVSSAVILSVVVWLTCRLAARRVEGMDMLACLRRE
jgi:putative ABC transport system permease protein